MTPDALSERAKLALSLSTLTTWAYYSGYSNPTVEPPMLPDTRYHLAAHVRALLAELSRHADRAARVMEQEAENAGLRADVRNLTREVERLRAELFKLSGKGET